MRTVVRTHLPPLAEPREFLMSAWRDLRRSRGLAFAMARRDIRSQYRDSLFGVAGVVLTPVAMAAVAVGFRRTGILTVDSAAIPYGLFVLLGAILWTTLLDALNAPIYGLIAEQRLLARTGAPPEAIVLGKLGPVVLNAALKICLLAIAIAWYGVAVPASAILAPLGLLSLMALGTAIGLILAPLNLLYRDVSRVLASITTFWFFFSPVYFPAPSAGAIGAIMRGNPATPLLSDTRTLALAGLVADPARSLAVALSACAVLLCSWLYLRVVLRVAIEQTNE